MKKSLSTLLFIFAFFTTILAQDFCGGDHFYDSGGELGNYQNNENNITVISPPANAIVTITFLNFSLENNFDFLTVYDGPDVFSTELGVFTGNTLPGPFTSTHPTGSLTFKFTSDGSIVVSGWDAEVLCLSTTCPKPENLTVFNVGSTSADLNWDNGGSENNWEIEFGPFGFTQGNGTVINTSTKPITINGLSQGVRQQVYIRAVCNTDGETEYSQWSAPNIFVTSCGDFIAPFSENFSNNTTPGCWFEFGDEFWNYGLDASFAALNAGDHTIGGGTNYIYIDGSSPTGSGHISHIITPFIDVSNLTDSAVQFAVFSHNNNDATYNTLDVVLNEQNGISTNLLHLQQSIGNNWKVYTFNLDFITDTLVQLEFIVEENSPGNAFFNDILIDDIKVDESSALGNEDVIISQLTAYPNPVSEILTINANELISEIKVFDILGKIIFQQKQQNKTFFNLDFSNFSKGVYYLKVIVNNKQNVMEIVKN